MATIENLFKDLYQKSEVNRMTTNEKELLQIYEYDMLKGFVINGDDQNTGTKINEIVLFDINDISRWNDIFNKNQIEKDNPDLSITLTHNDLLIPYVLYHEQICYLHTDKECGNQVTSNTPISPNQTFYFVYEPQE